jgi:hypothetical protein
MTDEQKLKLEKFARENELSDGATDDLVEMVEDFELDAFVRGQDNVFEAME